MARGSWRKIEEEFEAVFGHFDGLELEVGGSFVGDFAKSFGTGPAEVGFAEVEGFSVGGVEETVVAFSDGGAARIFMVIVMGYFGEDL